MNSEKKSSSGIIAAGIVAVFALIVVAACFSGCTGNSQSPAEIQTLSVSGSTTVLPIAEACGEAYMVAHKDADIQVSGGGSSAGVQAVGEGTADIGMASRDLKSSESETYPGLEQHVVAKDGIAVIVYKTNPVSGLSTEQVKAIYKGEITNWKDVGGDEMEIVLVGRDSASGTREFFYEKVMGKEDFAATQLEKNSNGAVKQTVEQTPGAIGYVSMGYLDNTIKGLKMYNIEANVANVLNGSYPVARSLNMFTNGPATGLAKEYLDFILSADGQAIVTEEGYVTVA